MALSISNEKGVVNGCSGGQAAAQRPPCRVVGRRRARNEHRAAGIIALMLLLTALLAPAADAQQDPFDESPPLWEPLLWGGRAARPAGPDRNHSSTSASGNAQAAGPRANPETRRDADKAPAGPADDQRPLTESEVGDGKYLPIFLASARPSRIVDGPPVLPHPYCRDPFDSLVVYNIPPLYTSPALPGEGIWDSKDTPAGEDGWPVIYRTSYRPSASHPNAIVHMLLFDMKRVSMRLYIGSAEPGVPPGASEVEQNRVADLLAVTNALWKQKHYPDAGAIYRGAVLRKMSHGMATIVAYKDGSVDVLEWNDGIPLSLVEDARQLKHLIVKDGRVVDTVVKAGEQVDSEIGLGFLLSEEPQPPPYFYWPGYSQSSALNYSDEWFIATRSAFGIRKDGNLVFAAAHHISTKDLAKAMVLAGCDRALHGDANPHNVLGNLYYLNDSGNIVKRVKLSPDQKDHTLTRYIDKTYTSDYFGFFKKRKGEDSKWLAGAQ